MAKKKKTRDAGSTPRIQNRKARFNYEILEKFEAGLVLNGPEVKSIRAGQMTIAEAYIRGIQGELWLMGANISPYANAGYAVQDPVRPRKLLLHRREIKKILGAISEKGYTAVPLTVYFNQRGHIKLELALARGKAQHDKRETLKKKAQSRDAERQLRNAKIRG